MDRARRHQRGLARLALLLLALVAELTGRSLAHRLDFGRHVETPYSGAQYYPILLAVVKVAVALMMARVAWRFVKARTRRARRTPAARRARFAGRAVRAARPDRALCAALARVFSRHVAHLPAAGRRGGNLCRSVAAARALAAHRRAAGLRSSLRRRRSCLSRGRKLALRLRELCARHGSACVSPPGREPSVAAANRRRARHSAEPLRARVRSQASSRACLGLRRFGVRGSLCTDFDPGRGTS